MTLFRELMHSIWCRVMHGHVMVAIRRSDAGTLYECARCPRVELLKTL